MAYVFVCDFSGKGSIPKVTIRGDGNINIAVGSSDVVINPAEAVKLRDDLSRAITEAATAAAKAVQAAGEAA